MQHVRVALYTTKPGVVDEAIRRAEEGLAPLFRSQPGFVAYGVIKTGAESLISVSIWQSEQQATAAVQTAADWVRQNLADQVTSVSNHVGDLSFFSSLAPIGS
ncbi:MAG TPA: antibiotic biosynthesis monooxygenase [Ktedonobacterales bacterium]|nr:antibiotic biosynthesis monooxygenase [Ktedonobacterales bacterium]